MTIFGTILARHSRPSLSTVEFSKVSEGDEENDESDASTSKWRQVDICRKCLSQVRHRKENLSSQSGQSLLGEREKGRARLCHITSPQIHRSRDTISSGRKIPIMNDRQKPKQTWI
jgi:hypothetical protein